MSHHVFFPAIAGPRANHPGHLHDRDIVILGPSPEHPGAVRHCVK